MKHLHTLITRMSPLLVFLTVFLPAITFAQYGQKVDVYLQSGLSGGVVMESPEAVKHIAGILLENGNDAIVWRGKHMDPEVVDGELLFDFGKDAANLEGQYTLYLSLYDEANNRMGMGDIAVEFSGGQMFDLFEDVEVRHERYKSVVTATYASRQGDKNVFLRGIIKNSSDEIVSELGGPLHSVLNGTEKELALDIFWPDAPGRYSLEVGVEDESGTILTGEALRTHVVPGEYAFVVAANPDRDLKDADEFVIDIHGALSTNRTYDLNLSLTQRNGDSVVGSSEKVIEVQPGEGLRFSAEQDFDIDKKAEVLELTAAVVNPDTKAVIGSETYAWATQPGVTLAAPSTGNAIATGEAATSKGDAKDYMKLYVLGGLLFIIGLLFYLFLSNKKGRLSAIVLLATLSGSSTFAADITSNYDYGEILLTNGASYSTQVDGSSLVELDGIIKNTAGQSAFTDQALQSVNVAFGDDLGTGSEVVEYSATVNREDVYVGQYNPADPEYSYYHFVVDIEGQVISDGLYEAEVEFVFENGDTVTAIRNDYARIDSTDPTVSLDLSSATLEKTEQGYTFTCNDDSDCLDQPDVGGNGVFSDTDNVFTANIRGNFCSDGSSDRVCKTQTATEKFVEYEVCDHAGNCGSNALAAGQHLFYYDPFPPRLTEIQILRVEVEGDGGSGGFNFGAPAGGSIDVVRDETTGEILSLKERNGGSQDGYTPDNRWAYTNAQREGGSAVPTENTISAHAQFAFDLVDDSDTTITNTQIGDGDLDTTLTEDGYTRTFTVTDINNAGPASDPDACGEHAYNFATETQDTDREYGSDNRSSDFFFGPSADEPTVSKCRQRKVVCSNGIGHSGFWDRSLNPTQAAPEPWECTPDGVPYGTGETFCQDDHQNCCPIGHTYNASTDSCEQTFQCDVLRTNQIEANNGWVNQGTPTMVNHPMEVSATPGDDASVTTNTCAWGCDDNYMEDPSTPYMCTPDCTDGEFPLCLGLECLGGGTINDNGTPADPSDDFCS